jgi:thiosulfate reductase cytochrome b subunit
MVTNGEFATRDCAGCHGSESNVTAPLTLSGYTPGGVQPTLLQTGSTALTGELTFSDGALTFQPESETLYIIGHDNVTWIDWTGILLFLGTFVGVFVHGGLRYIAAKQNPPAEPALQEIYMYTVYERLWHWLQTAAILLLIFTGLIIHKPSMFGAFSFSYMVQVHNVLGFILLANAALAAFYHFASGEIKQYLPQPHGFFNQMMTQATFYVRGIFKNEPHPFDKTARRKLNPLQQVTYLAILNVLLPLQIITGVLIWGAQRWPQIADSLGGLPFLAPFHTLIAWLFATFIVMHVYLTTTGHTPLAGIKSMIMGWDEVEVHGAPSHGD